MWKFALSNVGHAAQHLYKCWSFFAEHEGSPRFLWDRISSLHHTSMLYFGHNEFGRRMSEAMGVAYITALNKTLIPKRCSILWTVPSRQMFPGWGETFFNSRAAAWKLTASVTRMGVLPFGLLVGEQAWQLHAGLLVGVLGRGPSGKAHEDTYRAWPHAEAFVKLVQTNRPRSVSNATLFNLHHLTFREQALAIRKYQIIITTHGSHSVSLAFIKPCTVVIELLGEGYLVTMFSQLAIEAGGRAFFMYPGTSVLESAMHSAWNFNAGFRWMYRGRNAGEFAFLPADRVAEVLPVAIDAHMQCLRGDSKPPAGHDGIPYDNIPVMGGKTILNMNLTQKWLNDDAHCFECASARPSCCDSVEAKFAYVDGGFACAHCLKKFQRMSTADACRNATAACDKEKFACDEAARQKGWAHGGLICRFSNVQ